MRAARLARGLLPFLLLAGCLTPSPGVATPSLAAPPAEGGPIASFSGTGAIAILLDVSPEADYVVNVTSQGTGKADASALVLQGMNAEDRTFVAIHANDEGAARVSAHGQSRHVEQLRPRDGPFSADVSIFAGPNEFAGHVLFTVAASNTTSPLPFSLWVNGTGVEVLQVERGSASIIRPREEKAAAGLDPPAPALGGEAAAARRYGWTTTNGTIAYYVPSSGLTRAVIESERLSNGAEEWTTRRAAAALVAVQPSQDWKNGFVLWAPPASWTLDVDARASSGDPAGFILAGDVTLPEVASPTLL